MFKSSFPLLLTTHFGFLSQGALKRAGVKPESVEEVILGNVLNAGLGNSPAKKAAIVRTKFPLISIQNRPANLLLAPVRQLASLPTQFAGQSTRAVLQDSKVFKRSLFPLIFPINST